MSPAGTDADILLLTTACECADRLVQIRDAINADGVVITDPSDRTLPAPEATEARAGNCLRSGEAGGGVAPSYVGIFLSHKWLMAANLLLITNPD